MFLVMKEMKHYKNEEGLMISRRAFQLLVREVTLDLVPPELRKEICWQKSAMEAIQFGAEYFISDVFAMAQLAAIHARRETVMPRDMFLVYEMHHNGSGQVMQRLKLDLANYKRRKAKKEREDSLNYLKAGKK